MQHSEQKEKGDFLSFPVLVGIFVYFSAITIVMDIYWEIGAWYENPGLTSIGTILAVVLVASIATFVGWAIMKKGDS
jgi:hypothetical protein